MHILHILFAGIVLANIHTIAMEVTVQTEQRDQSKLPYELAKRNTYIKTYADLLENSNKFKNEIKNIPTEHNRIDVIAGHDQERQARIGAHAAGSYPIIHEDIVNLAQNFLQSKKQSLNPIDQEVYQDLDLIGFFNRLLTQRPLAFFNMRGGKDSYLLRNQEEGRGGFEAIGTKDQKEPLILHDYLSYQEMPISAFISISSPTYFINNGDRYNKAHIGKAGTYEEQGIYIGMVGPRFEENNTMESLHTLITDDKNTSENGYGLSGDIYDDKNPLTIWKNFYGLTFPTFSEAANGDQTRFIRCGTGNVYIDKNIYKKRIFYPIASYLINANLLAQHYKRKAYVHAIGIGLGGWSQTKQGLNISSYLAQPMLDVYADIIKKYDLSHIADINFARFPANITCGNCTNGEIFKTGLNTIKIHFTNREPADTLVGEDAGKLLIAAYAWDSNALPGNEYWQGLLHASGDPAAACCSTIAEIQNPYVNQDFICAKNMQVCLNTGAQISLLNYLTLKQSPYNVDTDQENEKDPIPQDEQENEQEPDKNDDKTSDATSITDTEILPSNILSPSDAKKLTTSPAKYYTDSEDDNTLLKGISKDLTQLTKEIGEEKPQNDLTQIQIPTGTAKPKSIPLGTAGQLISSTQNSGTFSWLPSFLQIWPFNRNNNKAHVVAPASLEQQLTESINKMSQTLAEKFPDQYPIINQSNKQSRFTYNVLKGCFGIGAIGLGVYAYSKWMKSQTTQPSVTSSWFTSLYNKWVYKQS